MEESNEYISDYYYDVNVSSYIDAYGQYFNNSSSEMYLYDYDSITSSQRKSAACQLYSSGQFLHSISLWSYSLC